MNSHIFYLCGCMCLGDVRDNRFQQLVVTFHIFAILRLFLKLATQFSQRFVITHSVGFKELQCLFCVCASVLNVAVTTNVNSGIGMNWACDFGVFIRRCIDLSEKKDDVGFQRVIPVFGDGVCPFRCSF